VHFRWNFIAETPSTGGYVKNASGDASNIRIYGNVMGNGNPISCNTGTGTGWRVFNNTFFGISGGPTQGDCAMSGWLVYNNIMFNGPYSPGLDGTHDHNWYSKISSGSCNMNPAAHENVNKKYPGSCDNVTESADPFVNSAGRTPEDWRLSVALAAWPGTNVCALDACTGEKKYNVDAFGTARAADGVWDRGAMELGASTIKLPPPANLRIQP